MPDIMKLCSLNTENNIRLWQLAIYMELLKGFGGSEVVFGVLVNISI